MTATSLLLLGALAMPSLRESAGERMGYSINFLGMRMGTAAIAVQPQAGGLVPVELEAHTTGLAGAMYDFQEKLVSHLHPESGLPELVVLDTREGSWKHHDVTTYRRAEGTAVLVEKGKTTSTKQVPIEPQTLDFIAMVFQLRRLPLEPGRRHQFAVLSGNKLRQVTAQVVDREEVRTRAGTYQAFKIRVPTGFTGKFSEKNPTFLWLSDDERRIVVRLSTDFSFGGAVADLVSYRPASEGGDDEAEDQAAER